MNYLRASVLLAALAALFVVIGYGLFGLEGAGIALGLAGALNVWVWATADQRLLAAHGAREVEYAEDPGLVGMMRSLAARADMPPPRVFVARGRHGNAFATGRDPEHGCIVLCGPIEQELSRNELAAVIGHELAHIRSRDTLSRAIGLTLVGAIASLAVVLGLVGLAARRSGGGAVLVLAILALLIALIVHLLMSRGQEFSADRLGAELTDPSHMIAALQKLDAATTRITNRTALAHPATANLNVVNPIPRSWVARLFATHPPIARRIARLEAMRRG
jgi:heat shock protein HtpX